MTQKNNKSKVVTTDTNSLVNKTIPLPEYKIKIVVIESININTFGELVEKQLDVFEEWQKPELYFSTSNRGYSVLIKYLVRK